MKRALTVPVTPLVRFVEWLFSASAPGIDVLFGLFATAWCWLMVFRPAVFDKGAFVGMQWLPDRAWIAFFAVLAALHAFGIIFCWRWSRVIACLGSAWIWISVSVSFAKIEVTTGVLTYAILGMAALCGALYLSGQPRKAA